MSSPQPESKQHPDVIRQLRPEQHGRRTGQDVPGAATAVLATVAVAVVLAAFWGGVVWLVWSPLAAAITATVALVATMLVLGLLRAAGDVDAPESAEWNVDETAPQPSTTSVLLAA